MKIIQRIFLLFSVFILTSCVNHNDYTNYYESNKEELNLLIQKIQRCQYEEFYLVEEKIREVPEIEEIAKMLEDLDLEGYEKDSTWVFLCKSSFIDDATGLAYVPNLERKKNNEVLGFNPIKLKPINSQWWTIGWS